jgi:hypothetical protein
VAVSACCPGRTRHRPGLRVRVQGGRAYPLCILGFHCASRAAFFTDCASTAENSPDSHPQRTPETMSARSMPSPHTRRRQRTRRARSSLAGQAWCTPSGRSPATTTTMSQPIRSSVSSRRMSVTYLHSILCLFALAEHQRDQPARKTWPPSPPTGSSPPSTCRRPRASGIFELLGVSHRFGHRSAAKPTNTSTGLNTSPNQGNVGPEQRPSCPATPTHTADNESMSPEKTG